MDAIAPPRRHPNGEGAMPATSFTWSACPKHWWLGVSVLTVNGGTPQCLPHDGRPHSVDAAELRRRSVAA